MGGVGPLRKGPNPRRASRPLTALARRLTLIHEGGRPARRPESLRTNADERLPLASLGRVEGGDGIVEGFDVGDVRSQSSVAHPLDDLTQLGTIGLDDEVDCQAVGGARLGRADDGYQGSSGANQACGPLLDVSANDIEDQIDAADVFQGVVVEVDELLGAEVERLLAVGGAPRSDDMRASLARDCVTIVPTEPAAPCARTLCPA
jgi:hypothetical protein